MNLLMTDTPIDIPFVESSENHYIDLSKLQITNCIGCFGCWTKTPGKCAIRDDATKVYPIIAQSEHIIYVTNTVFGTYDTPMKTILERSIPIQKAFIRIHNNETHHVQRNVVLKKAIIFAYGTSSDEERAVFSKLIDRNANNMCFESYRIVFLNKSELNNAIAKEVATWEM